MSNVIFCVCGGGVCIVEDYGLLGYDVLLFDSSYRRFGASAFSVMEGGPRTLYFSKMCCMLRDSLKVALWLIIVPSRDW